MGKLMPLEWYLTASEYLKEEGLVKSWSDPCCWLWKPKGILRGIIAGHVGYFLFCGYPKDPEWLAPENGFKPGSNGVNGIHSVWGSDRETG
jgi:hypothetical protein